MTLEQEIKAFYYKYLAYDVEAMFLGYSEATSCEGEVAPESYPETWEKLTVENVNSAMQLKLRPLSSVTEAEWLEVFKAYLPKHISTMGINIERSYGFAKFTIPPKPDFEYEVVGWALFSNSVDDFRMGGENFTGKFLKASEVLYKLHVCLDHEVFLKGWATEK